MGFRLKSGQAISSEIRRIVLRQLDLATSELKAIGDVREITVRINSPGGAVFDGLTIHPRATTAPDHCE